MRQGMTIRAYARHRGCSHEAVRLAISSGRISTRPDGKIDPVAADRGWRENTDPMKGKGRAPRARGRAQVHDGNEPTASRPSPRAGGARLGTARASPR